MYSITIKNEKPKIISGFQMGPKGITLGIFNEIHYFSPSLNLSTDAGLMSHLLSTSCLKSIATSMDIIVVSNFWFC